MHVYKPFLTSTFVGSLLLLSPSLSAGAPPVQYDLSYSAACYEVVDEAVLTLEPEEKLVEVTFRVSVKTHSSTTDHLQELYFEFANLPRRMRVIDFSPREQFESAYLGDIEITTTKERQLNGSLSVGAKVPVPYGELLANASPGANVGAATKNSVRESAKRIAPREAILLAGTTTNGHGVFFKLKKSEQIPWDGLREFTCRFAVPKHWQADWLLFSAHAVMEGRSLFPAEPRRVAPARVLVALYAAGDVGAYRAAQEFAGAQTKLFQHLQETQQAAWGESVEDFFQKAKCKLLPFHRCEEKEPEEQETPSQRFFIARGRLDQLAG